MPSDVEAPKRLTLQRATYNLTCVLAPISGLSSFLFWGIAIWNQSGQWAAMGGLVIAFALVCVFTAWLAESSDTEAMREENASLKRRLDGYR